MKLKKRRKSDSFKKKNETKIIKNWISSIDLNSEKGAWSLLNAGWKLVMSLNRYHFDPQKSEFGDGIDWVK